MSRRHRNRTPEILRLLSEGPATRSQIVAALFPNPTKRDGHRIAYVLDGLQVRGSIRRAGLTYALTSGGQTHLAEFDGPPSVRVFARPAQEAA